MGSNPSAFPGDDRPVESVSWDNAQDFLGKLNALNDGYAYRLPTEAEWEYAAKAGTGRLVYGDLRDIAWYSVNSNDQTHPVGGKQPNAWGLYDMLGNVWEWVQDRYGVGYFGFASGSTAVDPPGPPPQYDDERAIRGGGLFTQSGLLWPTDLNLALRMGAAPKSKTNCFGFRCVRDKVSQ
jgi:formylglycine-generating enzyme required for sulfatase activity